MQAKSSSRRRSNFSAFQSRPSIANEQTIWVGDSCVGTIIRTGLLIQVEIIHPTSGKTYAKICRNLEELKATQDSAAMHCMSLGMELQEVEK